MANIILGIGGVVVAETMTEGGWGSVDSGGCMLTGETGDNWVAGPTVELQ